jgi:hypothetical protein
VLICTSSFHPAGEDKNRCEQAFSPYEDFLKSVLQDILLGNYSVFERESVIGLLINAFGFGM